MSGAATIRECDVCHCSDDGPMHVAGVMMGVDPSLGFQRHFACCAQVGCPDGSCEEIVSQHPEAAASGEHRPDAG